MSCISKAVLRKAWLLYMVIYKIAGDESLFYTIPAGKSKAIVQ